MGFDLPMSTLIHVIISVLGIIAGRVFGWIGWPSLKGFRLATDTVQSGMRLG